MSRRRPVFVQAACLVMLLNGFVSFPPVYAQTPNDYFSATRDEQLLRNVEKYHLGAESFWKEYNAGRYSDALPELYFVLRYFPNHPKALMLLGSVARLAKNPAVALPFYQKAITLYPKHAITHAQYGSYLVDIGQGDAGIEKLKEAIEMSPKLVQAHAWLAKAYHRNGSLDLAREAAERARGLGYTGELPRELEKDVSQ